MPAVSPMRPIHLLPTLAISALVAASLGACGSNPTAVSRPSGTAGNSSTGGLAGGSEEAGPGRSGTAGNGSELNVDPLGEGGAPLPEDITHLTLQVSLEQSAIEVHGAPLAVVAHARFDDGSSPNNVLWSVSNSSLGSIGDDGVFEANGYAAGALVISAQVGTVSASASLQIRVDISQNPDNLSESERSKLLQRGQGGARDLGPDSSFQFLYPYDNTVFPRGLAAPTLQFASANTTATYLEITTDGFSYAAFASASTPTRIVIPEAVWRGVTSSASAASAVNVQVSELSAGVVTGPITQHWSIAQGSLKGAIYYDTYRSLLAPTGGVMRIRPGQDAEVLQKGCTVCHSVSSQGNVLVTGVNWDKNPIDSEAFDLAADGSTKVRRIVNDGRVFSFGALTPDGTRLISNGIAPTPPMPRGLLGPFASQFYDTKSGNAIAVPTFSSQVTYAVTPNFSPDGTHLAFNNRDLSAGHTLSVMDYDSSSSPPTFSALRTILENPDKVVAWPSFLPDSTSIVFHEGDSFDTAQYQGGALYADLRMASLDGTNRTSLSQLNGYDSSGNSYLPYGEGEEGHLDYEPSVLPVPVGGYYWVLFTSRRAYGNTIAPGGSVARGNDKWGIPQGNEDESPSPRKKIWLAPIDLDYSGKVDPSHPAIYLPGQELDSGNMRAFAALEPCRANGRGCESAAECCTGFCRQTGRDNSGPVLTCVPPPENACSREDEACAVAADCCNSHELCINKRCASPTPEQPPVH